jgi:hypothetical protein
MVPEPIAEHVVFWRAFYLRTRFEHASMAEECGKYLKRIGKVSLVRSLLAYAIIGL